MEYCCHEATERHFDVARAHSELADYRQGSLKTPTRFLLEALRNLGGELPTILDVGGGVGVILHELMPGSTRTASFIEVSSVYLTIARNEAMRLEYDNRVQFFHGDLLEQHEVIESAEVTVLNRVICCYPDARSLLEAAARKTRDILALSYPRDLWYVHLADMWSNWRRHRRGDPFRSFVHSEKLIHETLTKAGFSRKYTRGNWTWKVELYRSDSAERVFQLPLSFSTG